MTVAEILAKDHRVLDDLFGMFLASPDRAGALRAIREFDEALRRHTRWEEEELFPAARERKLVAREEESERDRLFRELRLEHVQIRELSGMIVRQLGEGGDVRAARGIAANLARRWEAHTEREEREAIAFLEGGAGR
ncbi:MAG TPA: hemerythrin domain-containing protein [Thermoanaerobaculia bacterium]|nr:hemerythrin domain-containing protein [Thermoanaerobaculia bacterium]